jgi:hypothetical protein
MNKIELDPFVLRQFEPKTAGTNLHGIDPEKLTQYINSSTWIIKGPWDFCKYLILENEFGLTCNIIERTLEIEPYIRTGYSSRNDNELKVLSRWVELPSYYKKPQANYMVCILYSYDKLKEEFYSKEENKDLEFYLNDITDYGVVAIQATMEPNADPLPPITSIRNALGMEEGGNGEKLDKELYKKSIEFWDKYLLMK